MSRSRGELSLDLLSCVLPDDEGATHVHVERSDDAGLRDFHTHVQQLNHFHRDTRLLVAMETTSQNIESRNSILGLIVLIIILFIY